MSLNWIYFFPFSPNKLPNSSKPPRVRKRKISSSMKSCETLSQVFRRITKWGKGEGWWRSLMDRTPRPERSQRLGDVCSPCFFSSTAADVAFGQLPSSQSGWSPVCIWGSSSWPVLNWAALCPATFVTHQPNGMFPKNLWIYFTYPSCKKPIKSVWKEEAKIGSATNYADSHLCQSLFLF